MTEAIARAAVPVWEGYQLRLMKKDGPTEAWCYAPINDLGDALAVMVTGTSAQVLTIPQMIQQYPEFLVPTPKDSAKLPSAVTRQEPE